MHTVYVIVGGILLMVICVMVQRMSGVSKRNSALTFIPLWLVGSLVNMWVGVNQSGYTIAQELPILLIVFAVPAALAGLGAWKWR
ncbi:MAG: hypothetical protein ABIR16_00230 [Dokdonella sp.]